MSEVKDQVPVSLETMTSRNFFDAQDKDYTIKPIKIKNIEEFKNDKIFSAYFSMSDEKGKENLDKWLKRQLEYNDKPMTLELAMNHDWDVEDVNRFMRKIMGISG